MPCRDVPHDEQAAHEPRLAQFHRLVQIRDTKVLGARVLQRRRERRGAVAVRIGWDTATKGEDKRDSVRVCGGRLAASPFNTGATVTSAPTCARSALKLATTAGRDTVTVVGAKPKCRNWDAGATEQWVGGAGGLVCIASPRPGKTRRESMDTGKRQAIQNPG